MSTVLVHHIASPLGLFKFQKCRTYVCTNDEIQNLSIDTGRGSTRQDYLRRGRAEACIISTTVERSPVLIEQSGPCTIRFNYKIKIKPLWTVEERRNRGSVKYIHAPIKRHVGHPCCLRHGG